MLALGLGFFEAPPTEGACSGPGTGGLDWPVDPFTGLDLCVSRGVSSVGLSDSLDALVATGGGPGGSAGTGSGDFSACPELSGSR
jgi:hypothetical protein